VVAFVAPVVYLDVDDMLRLVAPTRPEVERQQPILLVLDSIEDPQNYGAILRTALAAGVAGVIVPTKNMAPVNEVTVKASAGAALQTRIARVSNLKETLHQLKERGYWVVGTDSDGAYTHQNFDWDRPLAIVMGSEGRGMHPAVKERCDAVVSIPLYGPVESLNVSVAAALVMYAAAGSPGRNDVATRDE
jgi:23S rRNA (guanosine2251-2'-O)-methyltransferase